MTPNDYLTLVQLKADMPDVAWGTTYDAALGVAITRVSRLIDSELGRAPGAFAVGSTNEIRYYTADSRGHGVLAFGSQNFGNQDLTIDEIAGLPTEVAVNETAANPSLSTSYTVYDPSWYWCVPENAALEGLPYTLLHIDILTSFKKFWYPFYRGIRVTGPFGFSTTAPDEIVQACEIQIVRWFKRAQQAYADVGAIAELGQLKYVNKLDRDVAEVLDLPKYQRVAL